MKYLDNFLNKQSINIYKSKSFIQEWKFVIIILLIVKIVTAIISGFSALNYTNDILFDVLNNTVFAFILSILILILVEYLTNTFIAKFWEYTFKAKIIVSIVLGIVSILLFLISFQMSCEGIKQFYVSKKDNSTQIVDSLNIISAQVKQDYNNRVLLLQTEIQIIKDNPQLWNGGKRIDLSQEQLTQIANYNNQIINIETELKTELQTIETNKNELLLVQSTEVNKQGTHYYTIVAIIMFVQLAVNGALMFFHKRNYYNIQGMKAYSQEIEELRQDYQHNIWNEVKNEGVSMFNLILSIFKNANQMNQITEPLAKSGTPKQQKNMIGFLKNVFGNDTKNDTNDTTKIVTKIVENDISLKNDTKNDTSNNSKLRICANCGKEYIYNHKKQIYCSDSCRQCAWEMKTGKKLHY